MQKKGARPDPFEAFDQSQHTGPADQSEHIALFRTRGFIETGTKQRVTDRLRRELLQQCQI